MNPKKPEQNKELLAIIKNFEEMKEEGKILYLEPEQYEDIAEYYIYESKPEKANEVTAMGLKIHPGNSRLIAMQIALYIDENKLAEARETINNVLNANDNSRHIRLMHAELLVLEGKAEEAEKIIESFLDEETDEMDCLDIGYLCLDIEFYDTASYWFKKCLEFSPENEDALSGLCESYQGMGRHAETIELFNKLIDKDPYSSEHWLGLARSYFSLSMPEKAVEACDFAIVANDKEGDAYTIKGHAYYHLENYKESINAYKEAWRLGSLEIEYAPMFVAFSYIGLEDWDNAHEYLKKAIARTDENSPIFPDLLINSARCLYHLGKYEEAHNALEYAHNLFPDNASICLYNARYYLQEGEREKAFIYFDKAIKADPTAETWYQMGVIALSCNDYELAQEAFEMVGDIDPDIFWTLGRDIKLEEDKGQLKISRKVIKQQLRELVNKTGQIPQIYDVEKFILEAQQRGTPPGKINEMINALDQLNNIIENYNIDQEEDEVDEEEQDDKN